MEKKEKRDYIYIGEGIMAQINNPIYYDNFTLNDTLEWLQHTDDCICEEFGFTKHDWKNIK